MNGQEFVNRFDFNDDGIFDQKINDMAPGEVYSLVREGENNLTLIRDPSQLQLTAQARGITGFPEDPAPGADAPRSLLLSIFSLTALLECSIRPMVDLRC